MKRTRTYDSQIKPLIEDSGLSGENSARKSVQFETFWTICEPIRAALFFWKR
jgi:hypothetical protein